MLHITSRRLEVFTAVVDNAGFTAAAVALNIAQPSVSAHIRALEERVGSPLFERLRGKEPQLTEAGRTLYAYAQNTLERAEDVSTQLGQPTNHRIRFACQRFAGSLLRKPLEKFSIKFPNVEMMVRSGTFEEVLGQFKSGAADLAFVLSGGEVPDVHTELLGRYRLAFVATPDHPLAGERLISPAALAKHPFVSAYLNSYFGKTLGRMLYSAGVPPLNIRSQAQEISMLREMVLAGMGINFSMRRSLLPDLESGALVELDVDLEPMYLELRYAKVARVSLPEIDELVQMVRESEGWA